MRKIVGLLTVLCALFSFDVLAQTKAVSGKVTDAKDGSPLAGVVVSYDGKNLATTGEDGSFTVNVPQNAKRLTFRFVGFNSVQADITGGSLAIGMTATADNLEEVIVTGYKTAQKKSFVGSSGNIKGEEVAAVPIASFDQAMQGRTPG